MNHKYIAQVQPSPPPYEKAIGSALSKIFPPWMLAIGAFALVFFIICNIASRKKNILAHARFATPREIKRMQRQVRKGEAHAVPNKFSLRFGTDHKYGVPEAGPAIAVVGRSGIGKTAFLIDPMLQHAIDQEATILCFDAKGVQLRRHLFYAIANGYMGKIFSPGIVYPKELQATINFLDFLREGKEDIMSLQLGTVLNLNLAEGKVSGDPFFGPNGNALLQAIFMIAKLFPDPDMLTAWNILSLPNLADRLYTAHTATQNSQEIQDALFTDLMYNPDFRWALQKAMGTISVADAEQTSGGIVASAVTQFQKMISPSLLAHLMHTNIPLDLEGKQLIFFQPWMEASTSTIPLCAAGIHMLVERNLLSGKKRDRPLIVFLDEFTSANWPGLERWTALLREQGIIVVLGYQSDAQTYERYGRDKADSIASNCAHKFYLSPGHDQTSKRLSDALGEKEIRYTEYSGGKSQKHRGKASLMSPQDVEGMGKGEVIIRSQALKHPWHITPRFDPEDPMVKRYAKSEEMLEKRCTGSNPDLQTSEEIYEGLELREILASGFIPSSKDVKNVQQMLKMQAESAEKASKGEESETKEISRSIEPQEVVF